MDRLSGERQAGGAIQALELYRGGAGRRRLQTESCALRGPSAVVVLLRALVAGRGEREGRGSALRESEREGAVPDAESAGRSFRECRCGSCIIIADRRGWSSGRSLKEVCKEVRY